MEKKTPYHAVKPGRMTGASISAGGDALSGAVAGKATAPKQTKRVKVPADNLSEAPNREQMPGDDGRENGCIPTACG